MDLFFPEGVRRKKERGSLVYSLTKLSIITRFVLLGHQPTLPQIVFLYACLSGSMLAGASIAHTILKPDLTIPELPTNTPLK